MPLIPLLILLVGTGVLSLGLLPRFERTDVIAITTALLAFIALGLFVPLGALPALVTLSPWGPPALLPLGLVLRVGPLSWIFGMGMLAMTLATLLTSVARPGGRRLLIRAAMLLLTFAGLAAVFSDNLLTIIMAWAGLDLIYFLVLVLLGRSEGVELQAVLNLAFNVAGTLLATGAALLISRESPSLSLAAAAQTSSSTLLITLAAVFRLGLFPLHLALPAEANIRQGLGTVLRLIPAAVALEIMARLASLGFTPTAQLWLTIFALGAAFVGAAQLWTIEDPRLGITYFVIAESGVVLLAGLWGGALALTAQSLALMLGGALIFLSCGHDAGRPWLSVAPVVGGAAVLGVPFTAGWGGAASLMQTLVIGGHWPILAGLVVAQAILAAGLFHTIFWPGELLEDVPWALVIYVGGLVVPLVGVVLTGWPGLAWLRAELGADIPLAAGAPVAGIWGLVAAAISVAAGLALWRFESVARGPASVVVGALLTLFRLDWLYRLIWRGVHFAETLIFNLAAVVEGEGAVLWVLAAIVLLWLALK